MLLLDEEQPKQDSAESEFKDVLLSLLMGQVHKRNYIMEELVILAGVRGCSS